MYDVGHQVLTGTSSLEKNISSNLSKPT